MTVLQQRLLTAGAAAAARPSPLSLYALTPLIGRDAALAELRSQVLDPLTRVITLVGPSGVGKSRLAVALFEQIRDEFDHGGAYLDVAANRSVDLVDSVAEALTGPGDPTGLALDRVIDHLRERHSLLVIDSAEHLVDTAARMVVALAAACPRLTVLVISTQKLGIYGEQVMRLGPLEVPGSTSNLDLTALARVPSVHLFVYRAQAVRSGFRLTLENHQAVAELCRRLDGLPLAIELAAARLQLTAPQSLLANLDDHPDLLWGTRANTLSRHLSLRTSFDWGWRRLGSEEQALLTQLAIFSGEFEGSEVPAVAGLECVPIQDLLASLVDKSFLLSTERPDGGVNFLVLGTTRAFLFDAASGSAEFARTRERHATHFLALAVAAEPELNGTAQRRWIDRLRQYQGDLEVAADYLIEHRDGIRAGELTAALRPYWLITGMPRTGMWRLREALSLGGQPDRLRARMLAALGELCGSVGDVEAAVEHLGAATQLFQACGDEWGTARCTHQLALIAHGRGDSAAAKRMLTAAACASRDAGDAVGQFVALGDLAAVYRDEGRAETAHQLAKDVVQQLTELGDEHAAAHVRYVLAEALTALGDLESAERHCREALQLLDRLGDQLGTVRGLVTQSVLLTAKYGRITENWRRVARILGAVETALTEIGACPAQHLAIAMEGLVLESRARLGDEAFCVAWAQGAPLGLPAAVAEALAPAALPRLADGLTYGTGTPLTPREQEVAELVAAGLTNREVARRLGIAEWTVVNHMRKVMRKLRCSSRVQVARWITRQQEQRKSA